MPSLRCKWKRKQRRPQFKREGENGANKIFIPEGYECVCKSRLFTYIRTLWMRPSIYRVQQINIISNREDTRRYINYSRTAMHTHCLCVNVWTREAAFIAYQNNWHWHYYIWACVFVNCCRSWHILVHARVHSLTLRCVKSERRCWQTAEHLVSKWSPWPPSSATVSAWNKLFLIWTGIVYSQSSEVPLAPRSRDKNKYGKSRQMWHLGVARKNGSRSAEV